MPKDPLAREQEMVVEVACHALTRTIAQYSPWVPTLCQSPQSPSAECSPI